MANFNHPYNAEGAFNHLMTEYLKYDTLYIGFDFDNTIWDYDNFKDNYEDNSDAVYWDVVNILKACKQMGLKLCLWTSCDKKEDEVIKTKLCTKWGIEPDYINCSPLSPNAKKPHFNILLDDKAGLEEAFQILCKLVFMNAAFNYTKENKEDNVS